MYDEGSKINTMKAGSPTQSMGKGIVVRLEKLRAASMENFHSASTLADNIVGCVPANTQGTVEKDNPHGCFLETIERIVCDMERISCDTRDQLARLHGAF